MLLEVTTAKLIVKQTR